MLFGDIVPGMTALVPEYGLGLVICKIDNFKEVRVRTFVDNIERNFDYQNVKVEPVGHFQPISLTLEIEVESDELYNRKFNS